MQKIWIVGAIIAVLVVVGGVAVWMLSSRPSAPLPPSEVTFPTATTTPGGNGEVTATMNVPARDGSSVRVLDFTKRPTTIEDTQNPGVFYLAGSPEYCLIDGGCPEAADIDAVTVLYNATNGSFTVALLDEPLSDVRRRAEKFLLAALGISETQLCTLNYYVGTDRGVSESYAGRNLGFSFCPGSTELP